MSVDAATIGPIPSKETEGELTDSNPSPAKIAKLSSIAATTLQGENVKATNGADHPNSDGILFVKKLSENAKIPTKGSAKAVGYDLYSAYDKVIPSRGREVVPTDVVVALPAGTYGRIAPRSGLALKHGIDVGAGVIDPDYRGNVGILLFNFSDTDFAVKAGDRVAQLICERVATPDVKEVAEIDETARGANGYGSTGVN
jgi:dUTP pyrophosphatase